MSDRHSATRTSLRTSGILVVFTLVFTAVMAATYSATRPTIAASEQEAKMRLIDEVLPRNTYDNALLDDYVVLGPTPALGLDEGGRIYRARRGAEASAVVLEAVAPDGYSGRIQLVIAVATDGRVSGVRVVSHKETPGLGDYIDPRKDRNKTEPWITQFTSKTLEALTPAGWKVQKDGGAFAYRVGATISARAVTNAAGRALDFVQQHRDALLTAPAGSRL